MFINRSFFNKHVSSFTEAKIPIIFALILFTLSFVMHEKNKSGQIKIFQKI